MASARSVRGRTVGVAAPVAVAFAILGLATIEKVSYVCQDNDR